MGLSNFPSAAEGVLPVLVMNTLMSVALLKNIFRSILQLGGAISASSSSASSSPYSLNSNVEAESDGEISSTGRRRVSVTEYRSLSRRGWGMAECCVCLCGFQGSEEVSELSCKHFFHKACLDKWFHNRHITCPLCRSVD